LRALISLSGGMDSTALLMRMLADGYEVTCLTYDYGQKHSIEIDRAKENIEYLRNNGYYVGHIIIDLKSAMASLYSALTSDEIAVPEGHYESEQMKKTVVPNRNAVFSSIMYGHAISISEKEQIDVTIALGVHSGDHAIYPDCRPEFYESLEKTLSMGNWGSERITFYLPYIEGTKSTILKDAHDSISALELDFDTVFTNTNTSYNPDEMGRSSGRSGADVERILAFHSIGRRDPLQYIDGWDKALADAQFEKSQHEDSP